MMFRALSKTYLSIVGCRLPAILCTLTTRIGRRRWSAMTTNCMPMEKRPSQRRKSNSNESHEWECTMVARIRAVRQRLDAWILSHLVAVDMRICISLYKWMYAMTAIESKTTRDNGHLSLKWTTIKRTHTHTQHAHACTHRTINNNNNRKYLSRLERRRQNRRKMKNNPNFWKNYYYCYYECFTQFECLFSQVWTGLTWRDRVGFLIKAHASAIRMKPKITENKIHQINWIDKTNAIHSLEWPGRGNCLEESHIPAVSISFTLSFSRSLLVAGTRIV